MYFLKTLIYGFTEKYQKFSGKISLAAVMFETVLNSTYKVYKVAKQCLIPCCLKTTALNILFEGG